MLGGGGRSRARLPARGLSPGVLPPPLRLTRVLTQLAQAHRVPCLPPRTSFLPWPPLGAWRQDPRSPGLAAWLPLSWVQSGPPCRRGSRSAPLPSGRQHASSCQASGWLPAPTQMGPCLSSRLLPDASRKATPPPGPVRVTSILTSCSPGPSPLHPPPPTPVRGPGSSDVPRGQASQQSPSLVRGG